MKTIRELLNLLIIVLLGYVDIVLVEQKELLLAILVLIPIGVVVIKDTFFIRDDNKNNKKTH